MECNPTIYKEKLITETLLRRLCFLINLSFYLIIHHRDYNKRQRRIFEAAGISLCNSLNTRPGFYNISLY